MSNFKVPTIVKTIAYFLNENVGASVYIVGGSVRDAIMGIPPKDFDIEVYGISIENLVKILSQFGDISVVGKQFGVIKLRFGSDEYDFSVPRRESKTGVGHQDFLIELDPSITLYEASKRRDFTINSIMVNVINDEIIDLHGGIDDIRNGILRPVSSAFSEDPLRILRGARFAARFGYKLSDKFGYVRKATDGFAFLSNERIREEWVKIFTSPFPGAAIQFLLDANVLHLYPEIASLVGIPQDPEWHPEGDVLTHTIHVMNFAAHIARRDNLSTEDTLHLVAAALTHDFGKVTHTKMLNGRWVAHGHEAASEAPARSFLSRIGFHNDFVDNIIPAVVLHMRHANFNGTRKEVRRLNQVCHDMPLLFRLIEADHSGRPPKPASIPSKAQQMKDLFLSMQQEGDTIKPLITGQMLINIGFKQGKHIGTIIKASLEAQIEEVFTTAEGAIEWVIRTYK